MNCISACGAEAVPEQHPGNEVRAEEPQWSLELEESLLDPAMETRLSLSGHRLSLAPVRAGSCSTAAWDGREGMEGKHRARARSLWTFYPHCLSSARAWHRQQQQQRQAGSFVQLEGCAKPTGKHPSSEQRRGQPSGMAVFSCKHSKALLPAPGFAMKVMAGHLGSLLHLVHGPHSLWH